MQLVIADDHPIFRSGLTDLLKKSLKDLTIVECENGLEALAMVRKIHPEVCILDVDMPEVNGLEVCKKIIAENLKTKIIILTMYREEIVCKQAFINGASGFIVKDHSATEIVECIETVLKGGKYVSRSQVPEFIKFLNSDQKKETIQSLLQTLSQGELKCLKLVCQGKSSKEIAGLLFLTEKTIENYRSKICKKLELDSRNNSLLLWVMENKDILLSVDDF